jgi:2-polyprenyl-3-methyl-5-hydroxy-6-metoxy-1,4-benzoquinol methylase
MRRSSPLVEEILSTVGRGRRWLDYGAGDGTLLETVSVLDSSAQLNAFDVTDTREAAIRERCLLEAFSTTLDDLNGHYDVIILNHVLEHLEAPTLILRSLAELLSPCGILAVQVPDLSRNMFDICVFDHVSHFCERSLSNLLAQQHHAYSTTTSLYHKELVGFIYGAELERSDTHGPAPNDKAESPSLVSVSTRLGKASRRIDALKATWGQMGVFGTSIAGLWVGTALGESLTHWVDEDADRVGRTLWDRVIYAPATVPGEALVVLPYVPSIADGLLKRLVQGSNLVVVSV